MMIRHAIASIRLSTNNKSHDWHYVSGIKTLVLRPLLDTPSKLKRSILSPSLLSPRALTLLPLPSSHSAKNAGVQEPKSNKKQEQDFSTACRNNHPTISYILLPSHSVARLPILSSKSPLPLFSGEGCIRRGLISSSCTISILAMTLSVWTIFWYLKIRFINLVIRGLDSSVPDLFFQDKNEMQQTLIW